MSKFFSDLGSFLSFLAAQGQLVRVPVEVDPRLEITEIALRTVKSGGPALFFERVKGSPYPLAINLLGSAQRMEWALGRPPGAIGEEIARAAEDLMPPKPSAVWRHRGLFARALKMKPRRSRGLPLSEAPDLDALPILTCWPEDGGRFLTLPLVITKSPSNGRRNVGMYRLQTFDKSTTGMHIQIERGGGAHYAEYEALGQPMPVAVALGGDPITILSSILPLPENMDEFAFAGFLRNAPVPMFRLANGLDAPANAEFVLEGHVPPTERRREGPFGDHFGHYSAAAPFPVFHISRVHRRAHPVFPATVVGKPPQEDKFMGNAVQEMLLPLLKLMRPELVDLWAYFEAGFHNLAVAAVRQRYPKEAVKTALGLMGQGQMSLTKCVVLVDPGVDVRKFDEVLEALRKNFVPAEDFILIPGTAQDTLDFTGPKMNLGSKMILDATAFGKKPRTANGPSLPPRGKGGPGQRGIEEFRNWADTLLVVKVKENGRFMVGQLLKDPALEEFKLIAAVSEDVPLDNNELLLWGIFTRFDCARDVVPAHVRLEGAWAKFDGPIGIDATWKKGYPAPLEMSSEIVKKVDRLWKDYGI